MKFLLATFLLAASLSASQTGLCFKINIKNHDFYIDMHHLSYDDYAITVFDAHGKYESSGRLKLQSRARCMDCNEDVFDIVDAPGQTIKFEGKRSNTMDPSSETGIMYLGLMLVSYTKENCPNLTPDAH